MKDCQAIVDIASEPLMRLFQEETERMVKHRLCKDKPCPKLCYKARRHVAMIVNYCWQKYAKLN